MRKTIGIISLLLSLNLFAGFTPLKIKNLSFNYDGDKGQATADSIHFQNDVGVMSVIQNINLPLDNDGRRMFVLRHPDHSVELGLLGMFFAGKATKHFNHIHADITDKTLTTTIKQFIVSDPKYWFNAREMKTICDQHDPGNEGLYEFEKFYNACMQGASLTTMDELDIKDLTRQKNGLASYEHFKKFYLEMQNNEFYLSFKTRSIIPITGKLKGKTDYDRDKKILIFKLESAKFAGISAWSETWGIIHQIIPEEAWIQEPYIYLPME